MELILFSHHKMRADDYRRQQHVRLDMMSEMGAGETHERC